METISTFPTSMFLDKKNIAKKQNSVGIQNRIDMGNLHTHKEVFGNLLDKMSSHYGVNMHELVRL
jgi:hypothetical protein